MKKVSFIFTLSYLLLTGKMFLRCKSDETNNNATDHNIILTTVLGVISVVDDVSIMFINNNWV